MYVFTATIFHTTQAWCVQILLKAVTCSDDTWSVELYTADGKSVEAILGLTPPARAQSRGAASSASEGMPSLEVGMLVFSCICDDDDDDNDSNYNKTNFTAAKFACVLDSSRMTCQKPTAEVCEDYLPFYLLNT